MKKVLIALVVLCSFAFSNNAVAQNKFGHINFQELIVLLPEYKTSEDSLRKFAQGLENKLQQLQAEYQKKVQEYQSAANMTEVAREIKLDEINALEQKIVALQGDAEQQLQAKESSLLKPLQEKLVNAVKAVAKESGYTYVFDTSPGSSLLYFPDADNITALVKKKLGLM
ncbi:MAG: OmpH family outer membrane protein [Chitinophagales bacterium]|nr:OmpH family outer membrane protein [Chitinophagales bacterium]